MEKTLTIFEFIISGILWGVIWAFAYFAVDFYKEGK